MNKIMIIEDERKIREELSALLKQAGYGVTAPEQFTEEAVAAKLREMEPDLILMDISLPGTSGVSLCGRLRTFTQVPVIFVTSRTGSMDELEALMAGGDDYVTKPYQMPVLLAHIQAVLKRTKHAGTQAETELCCKGVRVSLREAAVFYEGRSSELTKNELKLLWYLFSRQGEIVSREEIIDALWDQNVFLDDNALSVNITRIRNKLKELGAEQVIETKRGMGYRV